MGSPRFGPIRSAQRGGETLARRREFGWLARAGLIARGTVYGVVGILALKLAIGAGGKATNQQGALQAIAGEPFGKGLLIVMALGLAGYATWRLVRAGIGHGTVERDGGSYRVSAAASGLVYGGLCFTAVKILAGSGGNAGSSSPKKATGGVLGWTGGTVIVGVAGALLIGVGLYQGYRGISKKFLEESETEKMSRAVKRGFSAVGVFGHLARMVVFVLVGYGLIRAAIDYDPHRAIGLDGALSELARQSYGAFLLGLVAVGLIGFALYSTADARYRKI